MQHNRNVKLHTNIKEIMFCYSYCLVYIADPDLILPRGDMEFTTIGGA